MNVSTSSAEIISEFYIGNTISYFAYASLSLACYEYTITLGHEVRLLAQFRRARTAWLFFACRYIMLATAISSVLPATPKTCSNAFQAYDMVASLLPLVIAAIFAFMRMLSVFNHRWLPASIVLGLGLTPVLINVYVAWITSWAYVDHPIFGPSCFGSNSVTPQANLLLSLGARMPVIIVDVAVMVVTWIKLHRDAKEVSALRVRRSLSMALLRDGTVYFLALLILNVSQLIFDVVPILDYSNPICLLAAVLQPLLLSRFIMNLRQVNGADAGSSRLANFSSFSAPDFRVFSSDNPSGEETLNGEDLGGEEIVNKEGHADDTDQAQFIDVP